MPSKNGFKHKAKAVGAGSLIAWAVQQLQTRQPLTESAFSPKNLLFSTELYSMTNPTFKEQKLTVLARVCNDQIQTPCNWLAESHPCQKACHALQPPELTRVLYTRRCWPRHHITQPHHEPLCWRTSQRSAVMLTPGTTSQAPSRSLQGSMPRSAGRAAQPLVPFSLLFYIWATRSHGMFSIGTAVRTLLSSSIKALPCYHQPGRWWFTARLPSLHGAGQWQHFTIAQVVR